MADSNRLTGNTFLTVDHFTTLVNKLYFASSTGVDTTFCFRMGRAGGPLTEVAQTGEHGFA